MAIIERKIKFERNGKTVRRTVRANSEAEFLEKTRAILEKAAQESRITFTRVSEEWEEAHFKEIAYGTQISYTPALRRAREYFGDAALDEITPQDIKRLLDALAVQKFSAKTVKTQKVVIGLVYKFAVIQGYTKTNPAEYVTLPKHLKTEQRMPPEKETVEIIKNSVSAPFGLFAYFILYTGCRRGEALAMRWADIDFENNLVYVRQNIVFMNNKAVVCDHPKTKAGVRSIPLLSPLRTVLLEQPKEATYIFANENGIPLTETQYNHRLNAYKKATGAVFTPHQLRHEFATVLYEAGVDEGVAQTIMGHADIRTTQNIYTHIRQSKIQSAAALLEKYVG